MRVLTLEEMEVITGGGGCAPKKASVKSAGKSGSGRTAKAGSGKTGGSGGGSSGKTPTTTPVT